MNAETRDRFNSGTDQTSLTEGNSCWQTPPAVFEKLHDEFGFDIDLFAKSDSALMPIWFGPESDYAEDALAVHWPEFGSMGFFNPPYGAFIKRVLQHAANMAVLGFRSVGLLSLRLNAPMRTALFRSAVVEQWLFPDKRITFFENGAPRLDAKGNPMPAMFDSTLLVFGPDASTSPVIDEWKVPDHVPSEYRRKRAA